MQTHAEPQANKLPVRVMCAWHAEFFGTERVMREAAPGYEFHPETHGVCAECRKREMALFKSQAKI